MIDTYYEEALEDVHKRLDYIERINLMRNTAPTVPIYNPSNMPQDPVLAQIAVGTDNSFNWFAPDNTWHTQAGSLATPGVMPQDQIDGQIVIGTDGGFYWHITNWYTAAFVDSIPGIVPQDPIEAQIVVGSNNGFHWYSKDLSLTLKWRTF